MIASVPRPSVELYEAIEAIEATYGLSHEHSVGFNELALRLPVV
jgi:hypothetical protein